jgi:hypothetical protein
VDRRPIKVGHRQGINHALDAIPGTAPSREGRDLKPVSYRVAFGAGHCGDPLCELCCPDDLICHGFIPGADPSRCLYCGVKIEAHGSVSSQDTEEKR